MAIRSQYEIVRDWAQSFPAGGLYEHGRTVRARDRELTGRWETATLARFLPAGRKRSRPLFVVTGDVWGSPGWGHTNPQWETRTAVAAAAREIGADVLLVPFSALDGAGIDVDSIRPLEIRPDSNWDEYEPVPGEVDIDGLSGAGYRRAGPFGADYGAVSQWGGSAPARHYVHHWRDSNGRRYERRETVGEWRRYTFEGPRPADWESWRTWPVSEWRHEPLEVPEWESGAHRMDGARRRWGHTVDRDPETGEWRTVIHHHRLGDSLFLADVVGTRTVSRPVSVRDVVANARLCIRTERFERDRGDSSPEPASAKLARFDVDGTVSETVETRRRRRFVSSFDRNEPRPLYFLATLPHSSRARTVETAIQDLAPAAVHAALARGRTVYRQGDIFAIATNLTDVDVYGLATSRARLSQWTSGARPKRGEIGYRAPLSARDRREIRARVRARFVEIHRGAVRGAVESGRAYPRTRTRSHHASNESYRPRRARARGAVRWRSRDEYRARYGTNALAAWRRAWDEVWREWGRPTGYEPAERDEIRATLSVYGTAHSATEVVRARGGAVYVRGTMRHEPSLESGRTGGRDHVNLKLGDGRQWFLAVRNTVPRSSDSNGRA